MKKILFFLFTIALLASCKNQQQTIEGTVNNEESAKEMVEDDPVKYATFVKEAMKLYDLKDFANSSNKFEEGFDAIGGKAYPNDRYNASCSYALAGNSEKAFYHLFRLADGAKYSNLNHITNDKDLISLYKDKQWDKLIAIVKSNKEIKEKDLDMPLVAKLEKIHTEDQKYRNELDVLQEKYGWESEEMKAHWKIINEKDSLNLIEIKKILDTRGWLGENIIGREGNSTLFLVIQHSNIETQLQYLPMMQEAVKKGNANASSLALLEDRVALRQGKRQIYGSQIHTDKETQEMYVAPLVDPENVDKRRAEVGLGSLADYVRHWGLIWDIKKHQERTAKIESEKD